MDTVALKLGILHTYPEEFDLRGLPPDSQKFIDMFASVGAPLEHVVYEVARGEFPDQRTDCDAYLITGSPCGVYESHSWISELESFIREAYQSATPLVGICFGHQAVSQALGGEVRRSDAGWLLGLHSIKIAKKATWMDSEPSDHPLYFINQDQVVRLPDDAELLGSMEACQYAMYSMGSQVLCIQAHPEQPLHSMQVFTDQLEDGSYIDAETALRSRETMGAGQPDAKLFAGWITNFLQAAHRQSRA